MADDALLRDPPPPAAPAPTSTTSTTSTTSLPDPRAPLSYVCEEPIFAAVLRQAQQTPDAVAVEGEGVSLSYRALADASRKIALHLNSRGIVTGQNVTILSNRSPALISCMLGVLRSGASFAVADAAYPALRLSALVDRLRPSLLLVAGETPVPDALKERLPEADVVRVPDSGDVRLDVDADEPIDVDPAHAAYVMFTSGSTGQPKAVVTSHAPLVHFLRWHAAQHGLSSSDRFSMLSGLSHDPVLRDIFTPLSIGARVVVPSQATLFDPARLAAFLDEKKVTVVHLTPALGEVLAAGVQSRKLAVRHFFWGGDVVRRATLQTLQQAAPSSAHTNFYGATETPQAMGFSVVDPDGTGPVKVGRGIADVQLLVVDSNDGERGCRLCAPGELGEVWIRTPYLSDGYKGDESQTHAKFTVNPFTNLAGDRVYKTGDLGRYDDEGAVVLAGRADHQLKIRGFRVEPAEVTAAVEAVRGVARAVVAAREVAGNKALFAWYTTSSSEGTTSGPTPAELKAKIAEVLPPYMVPSFVHRLEQFPLLPNGKIDHASLPLSTQTEAPSSSSAPANPREEELAKIWAEVLSVQTVSVTESFLDLGGDSLSSLQVVVKMQQKGIADDVARGILQGRTIREIAAGVAPATTPSALPPQAQSNLLVNVVRGLLAILVISEHWLMGFSPDLYAKLQPVFGPLFNLATPGFVMVFGLSLGWTHFPKFQRDPKKTTRDLLVAAGIVYAAAFVAGLAKLAIFPMRGVDPTATEAAMSFFSVLLYYGAALATAPLWFLFLDKTKRPLLGGIALIGVFLIASKITWKLVGNAEVEGALYVIKGLLVAKFNYWKMSSAALVGLMAGLALRKRVGPPPALFLAGAGLAVTGLALGLFVKSHGAAFAGLADGDDMGLWRWVFCAGGVLLFAGAARAAQTANALATPVKALGVVGSLALPLFVLHILVVDIHHILQVVQLPVLASVGLTLTGFTVVVAAMIGRLYELHYGRGAAAP